MFEEITVYIEGLASTIELQVVIYLDTENTEFLWDDSLLGKARHASECFLPLFLDVELCVKQRGLFVCHFPP